MTYDGSTSKTLGRGRELVAFSITKGRCTAGGIPVMIGFQLWIALDGHDHSVPEWAIQCTGKFCGIAHQSAFITEPGVDKATFDSLDTTVHHIARCDAVSASLGIVDSNLCDAFD